MCGLTMDGIKMWTLSIDGIKDGIMTLESQLMEGDISSGIRNVLKEYQDQGYTWRPVDGSEFVYSLYRSEEDEFTLAGIDYVEDTDSDNEILSKFFSLDGNRYLELIINSANGVISSYLYTSGDNPEREYLLSSGVSPDLSPTKIIKESMKKIGYELDEVEMKEESSIVSLFKYIVGMFWAEILSDPYTEITTLYLFYGKDPASTIKISEIQTASRYQSHYEILANHMKLIDQRISEMK